MVIANLISKILSWKFALLALCSIVFFAHGARNYKFKDLEALSKSSEFKEFFLHAKDIPPGQRKTEWEVLVTKTARGYLERVKKFKILPIGDFKTLLSINSWPHLRNSENFVAETNHLLKNYFLKEIEKELSDELKDQLLIFWFENSQAYPIGFSIGKKLIEKGEKELAHTFIKPALKSPLANIYCEDSQIQPLIFSKILPILKNTSVGDPNFDVKMATVINRKCWREFRNSVITKLEGYQLDSKSKKQLIKILLLDRSLPLQEKTYAQFLFLLDSPPKSPELNYSWEALEVLSKNPQMRQEILKKFHSLNIFPDKSFQVNDSRLRALTQKILQSFPEFIDYYTKRCVSFLASNKTIINPTLNCVQLYRIVRKSPESSGLVPQVMTALNPYFSTIKQ